jgi:hypothetical protein
MRIYSNTDTASTDIANIQFPDAYTDSLAVASSNSAEISNYLKGSMLGYNLFWKKSQSNNKIPQVGS